MRNAVGKNIKAFREENKLSQEKLAETLNVTRQAISNWETGKTEPDIETLHNISVALGVTVEELIYGKDSGRAKISDKPVTITKTGISFGAALAMVISYVNWHSIGWAILHGALNWIYVIYYIIKFGLH